MKDRIQIDIKDLGVKFRLLSYGENTLGGFLKRVIRRKQQKGFWALRGVNLHVDEGECVGVIGRNGAGKSTLLRAIAAVVPPTEGSVAVTGRIVPLLELGIGFNPGLTGRENCYFTGSLFGLMRHEIRKILPEIIEFSELEDFIDLPLHTYSSGMFARLAFSLATHVDPEVLLIDEILGVGDEFFQKKSLMRIQKMINQGKATLLTSHNLDMLAFQCNRLFWLDQGRVVMEGDPKSIVKAYRECSGMPPGGGA